jgi:hypothetical protein
MGDTLSDLDVSVDYLLDGPELNRSIATGLRHIQSPFLGLPGQSPKEVGIRYLREIAIRYYPVNLRQIDRLAIDDPQTESTASGWWLRWLLQPPATLTDQIVLIAQQTVVPMVGLEAVVPEAGIRIVLRRRPGGNASTDNTYQVLSSNACLLPETTPLPVAEGLFEEDSANGRRKLIAAETVLRDLLQISVAAAQVTQRAIFLPPLEQGETSRVGFEIDFVAKVAPRDGNENGDQLGAHGHRLIVDGGGPNSGLRKRELRALVANCADVAFGKVFIQDPPTATGNPTIRATFYAHDLDPLRNTVELESLKPAADGVQQLSGAFVRVANKDNNPIGMEAPARKEPYHFCYSSRTDDFAAVSAYYHCTCAFRLADEFGCKPGNYFHEEEFPVRVSHRAPIILEKTSLVQYSTGMVPYVDGQVFTVNAQVLQDIVNPDRNNRIYKVREMRFALGDLGDTKYIPTLPEPNAHRDAFGAASDPRWVWHEFGHVVVLAGTSSLELSFAHSVGDSLAAIMSDPDSRLVQGFLNEDGRSMRGVTFPWLKDPLRRHDRLPEEGWSWNGTLNDPRPGRYPPALDPSGYIAEQILSSTLFRLYRAIGGDDVLSDLTPDRPMRRLAAEYIAYLILWAVGSLGSIRATPGDLATALMVADVLTIEFVRRGHARRGGALSKVIRWAFEQQGLYPPINATYPWNAPGAPNDLDLYLEDSRVGQYDSTDSWETLPDAMVIGTTGSHGSDQPPLLGKENLVHIFVRNLGPSPGSNLTVEAWTRRSAEKITTWEKDSIEWAPLTMVGTASPGPILPNGPPVSVATFSWTPNAPGHHGVLVSVSAPGDRCLLDSSLGLACAAGPTELAQLVPFDNNIGWRTWIL